MIDAPTTDALTAKADAAAFRRLVQRNEHDMKVAKKNDAFEARDVAWVAYMAVLVADAAYVAAATEERA